MRAFLAIILAAVSAPGFADDQWANSPYHAWMEQQVVNPWAPYMGGVSCCKHADRVKTQFRVSNDGKQDQWWFLDPSDGVWKEIPPGIIHEEYDPKMPAQLRTEGVLFIYQGKPTCFWIPEGGI